MTTQTAVTFPNIIAYFEARPKLRFLKMRKRDVALKRRRAAAGAFYIMVTTMEQDIPIGRIRATDGLWIRGSYSYNGALTDATLAVLAQIEPDVEDAMAAEGKASGSCCYCGLTLTDPESVEYGYGPVCARKYGLPHSNRHGF